MHSYASKAAALLLCLHLQYFAANSQSPTPVSSGSASAASGSALQVPQPPQPPPPHEPPLPPPGTQPLLPDQCATGVEVADLNTAVGFAVAEKLHVDLGEAAQCTGVVVRWELCYSMEPGSLSGTDDLKLVVFRKANGGTRYKISVYEVDVVETDPESVDESTCQYAEPQEEIWIREGDHLGFISGGSIRVALSSSEGSNYYQYTSLLQGGVSNIESVQEDQLQLLNQTIAPVIRAVMNISLQTSAIPLPTMDPTNHSTPCPSEDGNNNSNNNRYLGIFSSAVFISVVVAIVIVIVVLVLIVCVLAVCLCKIKFCRCCKRRKKQEASDPISDQSMQYNDLYVHRDPRQIIVDGRRYSTQLQENPAYGSPQENIPPIIRTNNRSDNQTLGRGMEHTYESIH